MSFFLTNLKRLVTVSIFLSIVASQRAAASGMEAVFNSSSYTAQTGSAISGSISLLQMNCVDTLWEWHQSNPLTECMNVLAGTGSHPITASDVNYFGSCQNPVTWPTLDFNPRGFSISCINTQPGYDKTGIISIDWYGCVPQSGPVGPKSATVTISNANSVINAAIFNGTSLQPGTNIIRGFGSQTTTVRFYRASNDTYNTRTINYTLSGSSAVSGTDYTGSLNGTATISAGSNYVDIPVSISSNLAILNDTFLTVTLQPGMYQIGANNYVNLWLLSNFPEIGVQTTTSVINQGGTASLVFVKYPRYGSLATPYYPQITAQFSLGGNAVNGTDYTPLLSGSIVIPAGTSQLTTNFVATVYTNFVGAKNVTVTLQPNGYYVSANYPSTSVSILPSSGTAPTSSFVEVRFARNYVYPTSAATSLTVSRTGAITNAISVGLIVNGTATAGTDYSAVPSSVTLAAGVYFTNIPLAMNTNQALSAAKTIVVGLQLSASYFAGLNTNTVLTLLQSSPYLNFANSPKGRYVRGSGYAPAYWTQVIPLDYQTGSLFSNVDGNCSTMFPGHTSWTNQTFYHYNATNVSSQTVAANRIVFNNPIVAFGERTGGTPIYTGQPYSYGIYAGDPTLAATKITISVYNRSTFQLTAVVPIKMPDSNSIAYYASNGFAFTTNAFGLTTTLSDTPFLDWGTSSQGAYVLTHTASSQSTNYYYLISVSGYPNGGASPMAMTSAGSIAPSMLYTLEFGVRPPWRAVYIDQPHFDGKPLPPFYAGMTLNEILTNAPIVTNQVSFNPASAMMLDNSPELRRHPALDQFVADMGNDPIALANFVLNEIDLTDPIDYSDSGTISEESINPPGVSRGALGAFLEKQGSPIEQCALLVYLLRQSGVPAVYQFAPHNGMKILDARLSRILKFQVHGGFDEAGQQYTTNSMLAVNYPWVSAYIGSKWVHIFPWLKDYSISEGVDLYDYMPTNYPNAYAWVKDYIYANSNLMSLAVDGDSTPRVILPAFLKQTLQLNHPGVSVDDIGLQVENRKHYYSRWQDFPMPTYVTNFSTAIDNLSSGSLGSISPGLANIFDTLSVEIFSKNNPGKDIQTGDLRLCDLHNREFYIYQSITNTTQVALNLILLPFSTNITSEASFTNDSTLTSRQVLKLVLDSSDDGLTLRFRSHRHRTFAPSYAIDPALAFMDFWGDHEIDIDRPLRKGDQAAICMSYGRVTRDMLNIHAAKLFQMENAVRKNPAVTNTLSPDVFEGATMFLAGMSYYQKVSDFDHFIQNLHKVNLLSSWAIGLSKVSPAYDGSGQLSNGTDPVLPNIDMWFNTTAAIGNESARLDSGLTPDLIRQNYYLMSIANGSAEEHQTLNRFYQQANGVSTVRLLQLSQVAGSGIVALNVSNYVAQGDTYYQGLPLKYWDSGIWASVVSAFQDVNDGSYVSAYITPGPTGNGFYKGMGALILGWYQWQAAVSPGNMNGGFGTQLNPNSLNKGTTPVWDFLYADDPTISFSEPQPNSTVANNNAAKYNANYYYNKFSSGALVLDTPIKQWAAINSQLYGTAVSGDQNANMANGFLFNQSKGGVGPSSDHGSGFFESVLDPVHSITGEFLVNETDLQLPGPLPLTLSRNYTSQNLDDNQFGTGWKFSIMPYLVVGNGSTNIFAADMDGAVMTYVRTNQSTSVWIPTLTANPDLNNETTAGAGGMANRLRDRLVQTVNGATTNFTLYGADGSVRFFKLMSFDNGILNVTRPFLQNWTDNRGNYFNFAYGTNASQNDFGQVRRIQASNGNFLGFYYDVMGHVIEAYAGDGRRLYYEYDDFGDLVTVTLPDGSQRSYVYQHGTQAVTNGTAVYSTHLITEEDKPDGRVLQNTYDDQRRVTNQMSTAGVDLTPVRTARFVYANNFVFTNSFTNKINGYTLIVDAYNHTNRYDYTNSLIIKITDPLNQTLRQSWYADDSFAPGYPRSLSQIIDKRGLTNQFQYDGNGNVTNKITLGELTGDGIATQSATNRTVYNTNSLPTQMTDAAGNTTVVVYDPTFNYLPQQVVRYAGATPISTNYSFYGNATNVVINGSLTLTNLAFGLPIRQIKAYGSSDAATNDIGYDGHGFITQSIRYTGTADPNVASTFYYNLRGQMVNQVDSLGAYSFFDYDALNRPTVQENYDESGKPLSWNLNYYNENGDLIWADGPRFNPEDYVFYDYDGDGRRSTEIHWRSEAKPDGSGVQAPAGYNLYAQSFFQYDRLGNLQRAVDPRGYILTNIWDTVSRLMIQKHLDTNGTEITSEGFSYEPGGQVQNHTNTLGGVTTTIYTDTGKREYRKNADGSTNAWRYYLDGRVKREIQANGAYWQTTFDDSNFITTRTFYTATGTPLVTNSVQTDRRGNVVKRVDARNNVFTTAFDDLDRPKVTAGPAVATVKCVMSGSYPVYITNTLAQTATNFYDAAGRVSTCKNSLGETTVIIMDALGRTTTNQTYSGAGALVREKYFTYSPDHNGVTVTEGSGAASISHTTWTDNDGHPVLSIAYPSAGLTEFTLNQFDLAGNNIASQHNSMASGIITTWTTVSNVFDGLNRAVAKIDRDNSVTTYSYNDLNELLSRTMAGNGPAWSATYNNAGQMLTEKNVNGASSTRLTTYAYFASGPFAGLLQTKTDASGVTCANSYDDWLRVVTNNYTGAQAQQKMTTSWQYELRGLVTGIFERFVNTDTGPSTSIQRTYDAYGQLATEAVNGGPTNYLVTQNWDAAGRRSQMNISTNTYGFVWKADGELTVVANNSGSAAYGYDTAGQLNTRAVGNRYTSVDARDGEGRPLAISTTVNTLAQMNESLAWSGDGLLYTHTLNRADGMNDGRNYSYAAASRRLTQEKANVAAGVYWTNNFAYDRGVAGGPGVLTAAGAGAASWSSSVDAFSRPSIGTNNLVWWPAYGGVNGQATMSAFLDSLPVPVTAVGTNAMRWAASLELTSGTHRLVVGGLQPLGVYTALATNTFTNSVAYQTTTDTYDGSGNVTSRVWNKSAGGQFRTQSLLWDARGRLFAITDRDKTNSGYNWTATYDGLNRRLATSCALVTNNIVVNLPPAGVQSYYDPLVEFLEVAVTYGVPRGSLTEWKLYGPDLNGVYGGLNGTGGLEATSPGGNLFNPLVSDYRGNVVGAVTNGAMSWNPARPTGYGSVPGYRPLPLGNGAGISLASAWRGRWADMTGYYNVGLRPYDPIAGRWLSYDSAWNGSDPNAYSFCGGDPVNGFDADGRCIEKTGDFFYHGGPASYLLNGIGNTLNGYSGDNSYLGASASFAGTLFDEAGASVAPSTYVDGAKSFGHNVAGYYNDGGLLPATSYALTGWNVGAMYSGAANFDLHYDTAGQPVGDAFQRGAVFSSGLASTAGLAAGGLGVWNWATAVPAAPSGLANLHYYSPESLGQDLPHFSIETLGEDGMHTHQVVTGPNSTTVVQAEGLPQPSATISIPLSDPMAAQAMQLQQLGAQLGQYSLRNNSCLTTAGDVLRAGGADVPLGNAALRAWVKNQLQ